MYRFFVFRVFIIIILIIVILRGNPTVKLVGEAMNKTLVFIVVRKEA